MIVQPDEPEAARTWIVSLADLLSLLLSFMVMLYAMSDVSSGVSWPGVDRLADTVDLQGRQTPEEKSRFGADDARPAKPLHGGYLQNIVDVGLQAEGVRDLLVLQTLSERLVISLRAAPPRAAESAALSAEERRALSGLGRVLGRLDNRIETRSRPVPTRFGRPAEASKTDDGTSAKDASVDTATTEDLTGRWRSALGRALAAADTLAQAGIGRPVAAYALADPHGDGLRERTGDGSAPVAPLIDVVVLESPEE